MKIFIGSKIVSTIVALMILLVSNIFPAGDINVNKSFLFNGSSSSLKILDGSPVNSDAVQSGFSYFNSNSSSNKKITIDAWIYLLSDNPGVTMPVIKRVVNNGTAFSMYVKDGAAFFSVGTSATVSTSIAFPSFSAFKWTRLTGTFDGQNLKIYFDGVLAESKVVQLGSTYTTGEGLFIGKYGNEAFNGLIDEVRIFNTALTSGQINSCSGNGNPSSSLPTNLLPFLNGRWSFTEFYSYYGTMVLKDLSSKKNHLLISSISEIYQSDKLPFFVVNSELDLPDILPGDGTPNAGNGLVTFRSAIQEANALSGVQKIYFYKSNSQQFVITALSDFPAITDAVILDGTTQRGYSGNPLVSIVGGNSGVVVSSGGNIIV